MTDHLDQLRDSLAEISSRLREAVAAGNYDAAESLLLEQRMRFEQYRSGSSASDPHLHDMALDGERLLGRIVDMIRMQRSTDLAASEDRDRSGMRVVVRRHSFEPGL